MGEQKFIGTTEVAELLGVSRVTVFNRIKSGKIKAIKVGRNYIIEKSSLGPAFKNVSANQKQLVKRAVDKAFEDYGEILRRLGNE